LKPDWDEDLNHSMIFALLACQERRDVQPTRQTGRLQRRHSVLGDRVHVGTDIEQNLDCRCACGQGLLMEERPASFVGGVNQRRVVRDPVLKRGTIARLCSPSADKPFEPPSPGTAHGHKP
jgi:hypothetical protein